MYLHIFLFKVTKEFVGLFLLYMLKEIFLNYGLKV